jgi:hypothetical protein
VLPSIFLKFVGVCLLVLGLYDTKVYSYGLTHGGETFNFFGRSLPANHKIVRLGFTVVLVFYYTVGLWLLTEG